MKFQTQKSIKSYTRNQRSCKYLIFLTIFLLFLSCGGNNPETTITDEPDPNKNEEKITIPDDLSTIIATLVSRVALV